MNVEYERGYNRAKKDFNDKIKQTSDEFTEETRYYTPEGELYETIIETYKCPKNYISKDKIREILNKYDEQSNVKNIYWYEIEKDLQELL